MKTSDFRKNMYVFALRLTYGSCVILCDAPCTYILNLQFNSNSTSTHWYVLKLAVLTLLGALYISWSFLDQYTSSGCPYWQGEWFWFVFSYFLNNLFYSWSQLFYLITMSFKDVVHRSMVLMSFVHILNTPLGMVSLIVHFLSIFVANMFLSSCTPSEMLLVL